MKPPLLIVAASARSASQSARRCGWDSIAIDFFNDRDLASRQAFQVSSFEQVTETLLKELPQGPVLYGGGLENHSAVIDLLRKERPLWGNHSEVLQRARSPWTWHELSVDAAGVSFAPTYRTLPSSVTHRLWLRKSVASGGGMGIEVSSPVLFNFYQGQVFVSISKLV